MKEQLRHGSVQWIDLDKIDVLNPRVRSKRVHQEMIDNIAHVGLKRPITISRTSQEDATRYGLVCGQGRLEAYEQLKLPEIPAFVVDADRQHAMVYSLVENIARRKHRPVELLGEIRAMKERGMSTQEVATRLDVSTSYVNMICALLAKGETRLLSAVERGLIPVSRAVTISRSTAAEVRQWLTEAYAKKEIKGQRLGTLRRLLEQRAQRGKTEKGSRGGPRPKAPTAAELTRIYEKEAEKQRHAAKRATFTRERLIFATEAMRDLLREGEWISLLKSEGLDSMPRVLSEDVSGAKK
jgi:ParB family chromosome partitioning protein